MSYYMVTLYRSVDRCTHNGNETNVHGIPQLTKEAIDGLYKVGVKKPVALLEALKLKKIDEPTILQLNNYLATHRKKKYGVPNQNVQGLLDWCDEHLSVPDDEDEPFVLNKQWDVEGNQLVTLRICLSTKRLVSYAQFCEVLHADTTYKLNWQGYPVLIIGTSDKNPTFHPMAISVCFKEEADDFSFIFSSVKKAASDILGLKMEPLALMADASDAITNGFKDVFGENYVRLMCYFHVKKCVETHLRALLDFKKEILADLAILQIADSNEEFDRAANVFMDKWKQKALNNAKLADFLEYFSKQWLKVQRLWYEGAFQGGPSTNNGLESTNAVIKGDHTFRDRLPVQQFLSLLVDKVLPNWSTGRDPSKINSKVFATEPKITLKCWTLAYHWSSSNAELLSQNEGENTRRFYAASAQGTRLDEQLLERYLEQADSSTFKAYASRRTSVGKSVLFEIYGVPPSAIARFFKKNTSVSTLLDLVFTWGLHKHHWLHSFAPAYSIRLGRNKLFLCGLGAESLILVTI